MMRARLSAFRAGFPAILTVRAAYASLLTIVAAAVTAPSVAQIVQRDVAELVDDLLRGAPCAANASEAHLRLAIAGIDAPPLTIHRALSDISARDDVCLSTKMAAANVATELALGPTGRGLADVRDPSEVAAAVAAIVTEAYQEADMRAAQLTFEVGPPPRNMTRSRTAGF